MATPTHRQKQAHDALLTIRYQDQWRVDTLASMAHCSERLMYQMIEEPDKIKLQYIDNLRHALAEKGNYRLIDYLLPRGVVMAQTRIVKDANGSVDDELGELTVACADLRRAKQRGDADAMAQARARIRTIERRLESEEEMVRHSAAGSTVVHVPDASAMGGDGASIGRATGPEPE